MEGYKTLPSKPAAAEVAETRAAAISTCPRRTAVLVLHGIGAQEPYETLDQFARGLLRLFRDTHPSQEVCLRQQKANPNTHDKDWTQSFIRILPDPTDPNHVIDLYEYYWASVISDRISARQSLKFLIFTGLTPFQYLRDNLIIINRAEEGASTARKTAHLTYALIRELTRMIFIFIPVLALATLLYFIFAAPILGFAIGHQSPIYMSLFHAEALRLSEWAFLVLTLFRLLLVGMCIIFLAQEFFKAHDNTVVERSPTLYRWLMAAMLATLIVAPYALRTPARWAVAHLVSVFNHSLLVSSALALAALALVILLSLLSAIMRAAWLRGLKAVKRHPLLTAVAVLSALSLCTLLIPGERSLLYRSAPVIVRLLVLPGQVFWSRVLKVAALGLLVYVVRGFLTSAIGGLAVYLGSDSLSKNYDARSQILHECTDAILRLLSHQTQPSQPESSQPDLVQAKPHEDPPYDQVLLAAHSLGSVIAFDALNELIVRSLAGDPSVLRAPLEKIQGLLTFGCPLNKVVYFFRTRTSLRTTVLSRILYVLRPFRLRAPLPPEVNGPVVIPHPYPSNSPFGASFRWYNAYSPFDLISGRMVFYDADDNIAVERGVTPWTAHLSYWENDDLYRLFEKLLHPEVCAIAPISTPSTPLHSSAACDPPPPRLPSAGNPV